MLSKSVGVRLIILEYILKKNKARFFNLRNKNDFNNINDQQDIINFIQHEWTRKAVIYVSPNK